MVPGVSMVPSCNLVHSYLMPVVVNQLRAFLYLRGYGSKNVRQEVPKKAQ